MPKGKRIETVQEIANLAEARRSVIPSYYRNARSMPAAFVIGMTARTVLTMINRGLHVYVTKKEVTHGDA